MPHQCTSCGHEFSDGSKEMLSGCPDCGGNKFQFYPSGSTPDPEEQPPERESSVTQSVGKATTKVRDWVRRDETPPASASGAADAARPVAQADDDSIIEAPAEPPAESEVDREDRAQASARGEMVSPDELPAKPEKNPPAEGRVVGSPKAERPSMEELREELNDQFESIKILEPGQYELNLMELYDRDEYIIALQENGRYIIEVPETWIGGRDEEK
ncbi:MULTISPECIES: Zn-ribbon containing protein [unclassified Haladaptatus]|uniref:OapC/ArvC family zinc-ribbon domain-containing protein n=1 Tax=unclassified Haladaptatus TaxID=2622732 RepID=UPI0023E82BCA|nr:MULTISPECIES: Zn-ribbon containing protein [unclassified Haladaptatus]